MTRMEFEKQMERLAHFKKLDQHLLSAFWQAMEGWDVRAVERAISTILQEDDKFPKLGRFRELMGRQTGQSTENMDRFAFFRCPHCHEDFTVEISSFGRAGQYCCDGCRLYRSKHYSWSAEFAERLWTARTPGTPLVELP